jgi:hypothetical protein
MGAGSTKAHHVWLRVWAACLLCRLHGPVCGVVVRASSARRVWGTAAACRGVAYNNIGGKLPAQYSALTSLQVLCVAPDPMQMGVVSGLRLSRCSRPTAAQGDGACSCVDVSWHRGTEGNAACGTGAGSTKAHHVWLRVWARLGCAVQHCMTGLWRGRARSVSAA